MGIATAGPVKVDFHLQKIFHGQEQNRTGKLVSMRVSREQENFPFRSVPRKVESR